MNLGQLIRATRIAAQDTSSRNQLWSDEEIIQGLNEGQIEASRNGKLQKSTSMSLGETKAKCQITVSGTYGIISSILVGTENIINNSVTYTNDDFVTAALLTNEINDAGIFEATVDGNVITLVGLDGTGSSYNNTIPIITSTNTFATSTAFSGGVDGICVFRLKTNKREYKISNKILRFEAFYLGNSQKQLCVRDFSSLSDNQRKSFNTKGSVDVILYGVGTDSFYVGHLPSEKDYINATVFHLPLKDMKNNNDVPEIPEQYHSKLVHYALYKMYQKNDIEVDQLDISTFHYNKFIEEFGDNQFSSASNQTTNLNIFFGDY